MILADIENHRRLVNELADRVANLEALCDNTDVGDSLVDIQERYSKLLDKASVSSLLVIDSFKHLPFVYQYH